MFWSMCDGAWWSWISGPNFVVVVVVVVFWMRPNGGGCEGVDVGCCGILIAASKTVGPAVVWLLRFCICCCCFEGINVVVDSAEFFRLLVRATGEFDEHLGSSLGAIDTGFFVSLTLLLEAAAVVFRATGMMGAILAVFFSYVTWVGFLLLLLLVLLLLSATIGLDGVIITALDDVHKPSGVTDSWLELMFPLELPPPPPTFVIGIATALFIEAFIDLKLCWAAAADVPSVTSFFSL